jgi:bacteriochlorophyllide a dehydrogenase
MQTVAVVLERPEQLSLRTLELPAPGADDVVVDVEWSGISSGTERLLWSGRMPNFPGMGYPLVPGYETVGRIVRTNSPSTLQEGDRVFVPGANCFGDIKCLFGGAASRLVVPARRVVAIADAWQENGILLALAATAYHAIAGDRATLPQLIVGHGILGRLLARITVAMGAPAPVVWERNPERRGAAAGYSVIDPAADTRRDYAAICEASGDASILDNLIGRIAKGGEIALAGFYEAPLSFTFPPAFMREARIRVAAEWARPDIEAVTALVASGRLDLSGLITDRAAASDAASAYRTAFTDPHCLKMVLDWRQRQ